MIGCWLFYEQNGHAYPGGEWARDSAAPMKLICVGGSRWKSIAESFVVVESFLILGGGDQVNLILTHLTPSYTPEMTPGGI